MIIYQDFLAVIDRIIRRISHFFMSYISQRAIKMRMLKAQELSHYLNHDDTDAWKTVVHLCTAAFVNHKEAPSSVSAIVPV